MIGLQTSIGSRPHWITLQDPSVPLPDGDGDVLPPSWTNLVPPAVYAEIKPATARDLERLAAGTVLSSNMHVCRFSYHPQVSTHTRIVFGTRVFAITGVSDPEERHVETIVIAVEHLHAPPVVDTSWLQTGWMQ